mmetsp:Transcript_32275/g.75334  ORF Transcript_32275/g.75334 Transcript_32275/m.75334 type:complete len:290 (-) Transcript_32275:918-1787(-)
MIKKMRILRAITCDLAHFLASSMLVCISPRTSSELVTFSVIARFAASLASCTRCFSSALMRSTASSFSLITRCLYCLAFSTSSVGLTVCCPISHFFMAVLSLSDQSGGDESDESASCASDEGSDAKAWSRVCNSSTASESCAMSTSAALLEAACCCPSFTATCCPSLATGPPAPWDLSASSASASALEPASASEPASGSAPPATASEPNTPSASVASASEPASEPPSPSAMAVEPATPSTSTASTATGSSLPAEASVSWPPPSTTTSLLPAEVSISWSASASAFSSSAA